MDAGFALILVIAFGIIIRLSTIWTMQPSSDAFVYFYMGNSFLHHGEFIMPYGDYSGTSSIYSHHFPPLYPIYLSFFIALFGYTPFTLNLASALSGLLPIAAAYFATKDLYGKRKALAVSAVIAVEPISVAMGGIGFSENFVNFFFILTMWAILRSLKDERYILWAGLFAGLGYLTKSSMGWFFIIAGLAGFMWRFYYVKFAVLRDRYYLAAIGIFGAFFSVWALRNMARFWDGTFWGLFSSWQTSAYTSYVFATAISRPSELIYALFMRLIFFALIFFGSSMFWLKELKKAPKLEEENSALFLSIFLIYLLSWIISSMFWVVEHYPMFWALNARYIIPSFVPLLWLVFRYHDFESRDFRTKLGATVAVAVILTVSIATPLLFNQERADIQALEDLRGMAKRGDRVYVRGFQAYEAYLYLNDINVSVDIYISNSDRFILSGWTSENYSALGYHLVKEYRAGKGDPLRFSWECNLWERNG